MSVPMPVVPTWEEYYANDEYAQYECKMHRQMRDDVEARYEAARARACPRQQVLAEEHALAQLEVVKAMAARLEGMKAAAAKRAKRRIMGRL